MADKTFGVKVSEELLDRVKEMIDASGITAKEWFEKAVSMTELHAIKQGVTDYNQDLSELEVHTTRIYELVSSMIQRSIYIKDHAIKEYADRLDQKEAIISEYQSKVTTSQEEAKVAMQMASALETEKADLLKQLEELRSVNLNNQRLIDEYNEKNDTLSGLVSKYQSFAEENEKIKGDFSKERERLQSQLKEISSQNDHQQDEIKGLTQQIETLNRNHEIEVERLTERKDYEKDKALLECERNYQERLLTANNEYSERIRDLYNEISNVRKEYEDCLNH
jgi:chromosome segregation ATPase